MTATDKTPALHVCISRLDGTTAASLAARLREFEFGNIFDIPGVDAVTEHGPSGLSPVPAVTLEVKGRVDVADALDALARFMGDVPSRNGVTGPFVNEDDLMAPFIDDSDLMALVNATTEPVKGSGVRHAKKPSRRGIPAKFVQLFGYWVIAMSLFYVVTAVLYYGVYLVMK
jgi:hypothetical protein